MSRGQLLSFPPDLSSRSSRLRPSVVGVPPDPATGKRVNDDPRDPRDPRDPEGPRSPRKTPPLSSLSWVMALLVPLALAAIFATHGDDMQAVPVAERARLYEDTLASVKAACVPQRSWSPQDFCTQQVRTLVTFPQCDADCHALAQQLSPRPMK